MHSMKPGSVLPALVTGSVASVISTAALLALSHRETGRAVAALNGPSQWLWGRQAAYRRRARARYTAVGYVIHHLSSLLWASVYNHPRARRTLPQPTLRAAAVATLAAAVDYKVVPQRLTPGFEAQLPRGAVALVYGVFAAGLVLGDQLLHRVSSRPHGLIRASTRLPQRTSAAERHVR